MRLETLFHGSFYLTLALAALCLASSSTFFLPWMPVFVLGMLALLFLAWRQEGVWVLSEMAANHLGVFIAIGAAGWILYQIPRSEDDLLRAGVNWPAGLLPHLGPLLMILLIVKLFRPKRLPDYWVIQTMGLMMVTLAAVLADSHTFGLLAMLYLASLVWSLALYYPVRERQLIDAAAWAHDASANVASANVASAGRLPLFDATAARPAVAVPWRLWGLPRAALWTGVVALAGFMVFLAAPRQGQSQWDARNLSTISAANRRARDSAAIDLNRVGTVELPEGPAFAVTVRDHEGRPRNASSIQRWRTEVVEVHIAGRWYSFAQKELLGRYVLQPVALAAEPEPDRVRPGEWLVTLDVVPRTAGGLVLAEPLDWDRGFGLGPRLNRQPHAAGFFEVVPGCDIVMPARMRSRLHTFSYSQVIRVPDGNPRQPAPNIHEEYADHLANQPAPRPLQRWTHELMQRLPGLSGADRALDDRGRLAAPAHAKVAQALCDHLAQSGEYAYSLELRRKERDLDPTVDFLMNVKEGHCERYAGGLALMLRALGIRCRVVKGYLGGDTDEQGEAVVRLNSAHSWVEALVPGDSTKWQWLTLDPTPSFGTHSNVLVSWWRWCTDNLLDSRVLWRQFIMEYTPEQQGEVLGRLVVWLMSRRGLAVVLVLAGVAVAVVYGRRAGHGLLALLVQGWRTPAATPAGARVRFFDEFLRLAARRLGMRPSRGQTPREFAAEVGALLERRVDTRDLSHIPELLARRYYDQRYGGNTLTAPEHAVLQDWLTVLRKALR